MSEDVIQLNADGSGKKVRTLKRTVGVMVARYTHSLTPLALGLTETSLE